MTEGKLKIDTSINLPLIGSLLIFVAAGSMWVATVNGKLDSLAEVVADQAATRAQIEQLKAEILKNREETLENRRTYLEGKR